MSKSTSMHVFTVGLVLIGPIASAFDSADFRRAMAITDTVPTCSWRENTCIAARQAIFALDRPANPHSRYMWEMLAIEEICNQQNSDTCDGFGNGDECLWNVDAETCVPNPLNMLCKGSDARAVMKTLMTCGLLAEDGTAGACDQDGCKKVTMDLRTVFQEMGEKDKDEVDKKRNVEACVSSDFDEESEDDVKDLLKLIKAFKKGGSSKGKLPEERKPRPEKGEGKEGKRPGKYDDDDDKDEEDSSRRLRSLLDFISEDADEADADEARDTLINYVGDKGKGKCKVAKLAELFSKDRFKKESRKGCEAILDQTECEASVDDDDDGEACVWTDLNVCMKEEKARYIEENVDAQVFRMYDYLSLTCSRRTAAAACTLSTIPTSPDYQDALTNGNVVTMNDPNREDEAEQFGFESSIELEYESEQSDEDLENTLDAVKEELDNSCVENPINCPVQATIEEAGTASAARRSSVKRKLTQTTFIYDLTVSGRYDSLSEATAASTQLQTLIDSGDLASLVGGAAITSSSVSDIESVGGADASGAVTSRMSLVMACLAFAVAGVMGL